MPTPNSLTKESYPATAEQSGTVVSDPHPDFIPQAVITQHAQAIADEFAPHLLAGIEAFAQTNGLGPIDSPEAWSWALRASRYNAIYGVSRREASENMDSIHDIAPEIDEAGRYIDATGAVTPIINYAFHDYIQGLAKKPEKTVLEVNKSVARYALQACNGNDFVIRKKSQLLDLDPMTSFDTPEQLFDWHDLAHLLAASSSDGAFGVKYHDGLQDLERYYRALTEGEGMQDATGPPFADGLVFSELSKPVFEFYESQKLADGSPKYTYDEVKEKIAQELFQYLKGEKALLHSSTGKYLQPDRPINPLELAVAIQNKRYERRGAEVETSILVRGTPDGPRGNPSNDPLYPLDRSERLKFIATQGTNLDELLYFEARNVVRHRAHEDALGQVAVYLSQANIPDLAATTPRSRAENAELLDAIVKFFRMDDLRSGEEINLYKIVGAIATARNNRNT